MHRFINAEDVLANVDNNHDYDVVISSGAWGERFCNLFFNHIQRNHKLCLDRVKCKYEYVFYTHRYDYEKYKDKFIVPDITFIFKDNFNHPGGMNGSQIDYACKRGRPVILMAADCLHTPNLIPNLLTKYSNKDAVCTMSQRMFPELLNDISSQTSYEDAFKPRNFLNICLPRLHQRERRYFMDSYRATGTYGSMMYPVRKDGALIGILIRSFHLGVICINKPVLGMTGGYLDSNPFLGKLSSPDNIGMVTDSDDGFCVDITSDRNDTIYPPLDTMPVLTDLSQITKCREGWVGHAVHPVNESLMGFNIAMHSEPLDQGWLDLASTANEFVTRIYDGAIKNKPLDWGMLP